MMRLLLLLSFLLLSGCDSASDTARKEVEARAFKVSRIPWTAGLPENQLSIAAVSCRYQQGARCKELDDQLQDIADGIASCVDESNFCKAIRRYGVSDAPLLSQLPNPWSTIELPTDPWYRSIDNKFLDTQASLLEYRTELWWQWFWCWSWAILGLPAAAVSFICLKWWLAWRADVKANIDNKAWVQARDEERQKQAEAKAHLEDAMAEAEVMMRKVAERTAQETEQPGASVVEPSRDSDAREHAERLKNSAILAKQEEAARQDRCKKETAAAIAAAFTPMVKQ
jgi:hypothetical protein